jgi:hypothetical protein
MFYRPKLSGKAPDIGPTAGRPGRCGWLEYTSTGQAKDTCNLVFGPGAAKAVPGCQVGGKKI